MDRRYQQALDLFERAVKALGRKDFDRARDLLDKLIESYGEQQELVERARAYRAMCDRSPPPPRPKTFEELLNYGVVLHNRGDYTRRQVLPPGPRDPPPDESALYCLAAAQARAGDTPAALKALKSAIHANPASRAQARVTPTSSRCARGRRSRRSWRRRRTALVRRAHDLRGAGVRVEDPESTLVGPEVVVEPEPCCGRSRSRRAHHAQPEPSSALSSGSWTSRSAGAGDPRPLPAARVRGRGRSERRPVRPPAPRSRIGERARVGNFVELKKTHLGEGSKAQHLSYLGDATMGPGVNIGAGTITCNYDGVEKSPTRIEAGAFVGSDTRSWRPSRWERGLRGCRQHHHGGRP